MSKELDEAFNEAQPQIDAVQTELCRTLAQYGLENNIDPAVAITGVMSFAAKCVSGILLAKQDGDPADLDETIEVLCKTLNSGIRTYCREGKSIMDKIKSRVDAGECTKESLTQELGLKNLVDRNLHKPSTLSLSGSKLPWEA